MANPICKSLSVLPTLSSSNPNVEGILRIASQQHFVNDLLAFFCTHPPTTRPPLLSLATFVMLASSISLGQAGRPSYIPLDDNQYDSVNLQSLNVLVHAPIYAKAGAMPVSIQWSANSYCTIVNSKWACGAEAPTTTNFGAIAANSFMGGPTSTGWATAYPLVQEEIGCLMKGYSEYYYAAWVVREANGTLHPLPPADNIHVGGDSTYCLHTSFTDTTVDGSGLTLTASGSTGYSVGPVITPGGVVINQAVPSATSITDTNSNKLSIGTTEYYDTLGLTAASASPNVNSPTSVSWTDVNSGSPKVTVNTANVAFQTNFGCAGIAEVPPGASAPQFSGLTFPDGSKLSVAYEPTSGKTGYVTGRIQTLTLPTGGTVTYTYQGEDCTNQSFDYLTRKTSDGTTTYSATPAGSNGNGPYGAVTNVTDPGGNLTVYTFSVPSSTGTVVLTEVQQYQGNGTTLLNTTLYCYNSNTTNCAVATVNFPITQETVYTTPTGLSARKSTYTYDKYGNTLTDAEYDFGASSPTFTTTTVYGTWNGTACAAISANINNRPCTIVVTSGSNTSAQTRLSYDAYGNLTSKSTWTGGTSWLTSTATYNTNGTIATSHDAANNLTTYGYGGTGGCDGVFPTSVSSGGLTTYNTWNCTGGVLLTHKDANGKVTTYGYEDSANDADPFWRVSSITDPLGNETWKTYTPTSVETALSFDSSTNDVTSIVDGLGRPISTQVRQGPGSSTYDTSSASYAWSGNYRTFSTTMPCAVAAGAACSFSSGVTEGEFDPLGRPYTTTDGGGGTITKTYSKNDVLTVVGPAPTGEHTKSRQLEYDGLGRLTSVCEILSSGGTSCGQNTSASGYKASYAYSVPSAGGSQLVVTQSSQTRTYVYDPAGRLISETDPESGTTTYTFDSDSSGTCSGTYNGDLVRRKDAIGNNSCYTYDGLHRVLTVTYPSNTNTDSKHFTYDSATVDGVAMLNATGHLAEAWTCPPTGSCSTKKTDLGFGYSERGEQTDVYESTPNSGGYYHLTQSYWPNGSLDTIAGLPGMPTIYYGGSGGAGLDGEGRVTAIDASTGTNPVTSVTYTNSGTTEPIGSLTGVTFGSEDSDAFAYDVTTGRMTQYTLNVGSSSEIGKLSWNANGTLNSLAITDPFNSAGTQTCNDVYDDLGRLQSNSCGTTWAQTFSYDAYGNVTKSGSISWQPGYSATNNHYNLAGTSYDSNGNLLADSFNTYTWDAENRLAKANTVSVTYDALGRMVELPGQPTQFVYRPGGQQAFAQMLGQTIANFYVSTPGGGFAIYNASGIVQYNHSDWVGSARVISNPNRTENTDVAFAPFGETYIGNGWTQFTNEGNAWTVQNQPDRLLDFMYRRYSPVQGRWIQPDPSGLAAVDMTNPQTWNRYAYVANNPLSFIDPLGLNRQFPGGCDSDHYDCGSSGGSPSDPSAGGASDFSAIGNSDSDCPICSGTFGWFGTAGIQEGWFELGSVWGGYGSTIGNNWASAVMGNGTPESPYFIYVYVLAQYGQTPAFGPQGNLSGSGNSSWGWNFTKAFFGGLASSAGWKAVYHSTFDEGGCDNLLFETFAEGFNPLPGGDPDLGTALDLGPNTVAQAGRVAASAYGIYRGLSVPLRSSVYRGLQSSTYGYAAALEEAAPYLQVGFAGGSALYKAGSAAYNGECQ